MFKPYQNLNYVPPLHNFLDSHTTFQFMDIFCLFA
jgi:hypothetical protein